MIFIKAIHSRLSLSIVFLISLCTYIHAVPSSIKSDAIHITFGQNSHTVIGVSPIQSDKMKMAQFSREQAAVFAAKLHKSYCIFKQATISTTSSSSTHTSLGDFIVNIVEDPSYMYRKLDDLQGIHNELYHGYEIVLYDSEIESFTGTIEIKEEMYTKIADLVVKDGKVIAKATVNLVNDGFYTIKARAIR